jgi:hypothetical protein
MIAVAEIDADLLEIHPLPAHVAGQGMADRIEVRLLVDLRKADRIGERGIGFRDRDPAIGDDRPVGQVLDPRAQCRRDRENRASLLGLFAPRRIEVEQRLLQIDLFCDRIEQRADPRPAVNEQDDQQQQVRGLTGGSSSVSPLRRPLNSKPSTACRRSMRAIMWPGTKMESRPRRRKNAGSSSTASTTRPGSSGWPKPSQTAAGI